jgi:hypothetical protein
MCASWVERAKNLFEDTFHPAHIVAGVCSSPTVGQVQDLLECASTLTDRASSATGFAKYSQVLGQAGVQLELF